MTVVSVPATGHGGTQSHVDLIVVHGTVGPCTPGHSVGIAKYLNTKGYSVHEIVDPTTVTVMLPDHTIAYGDGTNTGHWQVELCDPQAGDPRRWFDGDHTAMLHLAAPRVRAAALRLGIPLERVQAPLFGKRGICGHGDVSRTWHDSTHTDPDSGGPFPWETFMALVTASPKQEAHDMTPAEMFAATINTGRETVTLAQLWARTYTMGQDNAKAIAVLKAELDAVKAKVGA